MNEIEDFKQKDEHKTTDNKKCIHLQTKQKVCIYNYVSLKYRIVPVQPNISTAIALFYCAEGMDDGRTGAVEAGTGGGGGNAAAIESAHSKKEMGRPLCRNATSMFQKTTALCCDCDTPSPFSRSSGDSSTCTPSSKIALNTSLRKAQGDNSSHQRGVPGPSLPTQEAAELHTVKRGTNWQPQ